MLKPRNQFAIRSLGFGAFTPSPSAQNPKQKNKLNLKTNLKLFVLF